MRWDISPGSFSVLRLSENIRMRRRRTPKLRREPHRRNPRLPTDAHCGPWPPRDRPPPPTLAPPWPQQAATPGGPWERAAATATDTGGEGLAPPCPGPARLAVPQPRQPDTAAHPYAGP